MTTSPLTSSQLTPPPRPITPRGRRRSWNERPVRVWLWLTLLVAAATIYFVVRDVGAASAERRLIRDGEPINAKVEAVDTYAKKDRVFARDQVRHVKLSYTVSSGQEYVNELDLPAARGMNIAVDDRVPIKVSPDDPHVVTAATEPQPLMAHLAVVVLFVPAVAVLVLITLWQRSRVLAVWRDGEPAAASVVDSHRSGLAPRSRVVRFTLAEGEDRRVFSTLWPNDAGELSPGDALDLIVPHDNPDRAIAVKLYE